MCASEGDELECQRLGLTWHSSNALCKPAYSDSESQAPLRPSFTAKLQLLMDRQRRLQIYSTHLKHFSQSSILVERAVVFYISLSHTPHPDRYKSRVLQRLHHLLLALQLLKKPVLSDYRQLRRA